MGLISTILYCTGFYTRVIMYFCSSSTITEQFILMVPKSGTRIIFPCTLISLSVFIMHKLPSFSIYVKFFHSQFFVLPKFSSDKTFVIKTQFAMKFTNLQAALRLNTNWWLSPNFRLQVVINDVYRETTDQPIDHSFLRPYQLFERMSYLYKFLLLIACTLAH